MRGLDPRIHDAAQVQSSCDNRHARLYAGHPRRTGVRGKQDVDGRVKPGHDN